MDDNISPVNDNISPTFAEFVKVLNQQKFTRREDPANLMETWARTCGDYEMVLVVPTNFGEYANSGRCNRWIRDAFNLARSGQIEEGLIHGALEDAYIAFVPVKS